MNDVTITVAGNVCQDVRHVVTDQGLHIASFRLATTSRRFDRGEGRWVDGETTYLTVTCWRYLAENVASSVGKGDPVIVVGRLRVRDWERDGMRGRSVEVDAAHVGHDLTRGTASFRRPQRYASLDGGDELSAEFAVLTERNAAAQTTGQGAGDDAAIAA